MSEDNKSKSTELNIRLIRESADVPTMQKVTPKEGAVKSSADVIKFGTAPSTPVKKK